MKQIFEKIFNYIDGHPILMAPITMIVVEVFFVCAIISIAIGKPIVDVK